VLGDGVVVSGDGSLDWPPLEPDEPPEPSLPPSGHGWPSCSWRPARGVVDPSEDGSLVDPGAALDDGSGLAAATIATPPVTSRAAAMPAVRTARRKPFGLGVSGGAIEASTHSSFHVMRYLLAVAC
jgi:hypothetical protein